MYNGRDGVITERDSSLIYMRARFYSPDLRRFINADLLHGDITNSLTLNRYAYCNGDPVNGIDPLGLLSIWAKLAIGVGAIVVGAAVVAATVATGGAAAAFATAAVAGLKAATISGVVSAAVGAGASAVEHRISTGEWEGAGEAAIEGAVNGFANGFMWGGILTGASQTIGGLSKYLSYRNHINHYDSGTGIGHTKFLSPDRYKQAAEIIKIKRRKQAYYDQGVRIYQSKILPIDISTKSLIHTHFEFLKNKLLRKKHIPIGIVGSGIAGGLVSIESDDKGDDFNCSNFSRK